MSLQRFAGKVALLTGCTQGIGLATARRLGQEGCKVVVSSRKETNVQEAVDLLQQDGIEASGMACHHGSAKDRQNIIQHTIEKYGGFDCVFMSAGVNTHSGNLLTVNESQFDKIFNINVKSNFMFIKECMPHLVKRGGGSIVTNATATAGDFGMTIMGEDIRLYAISKLTLSSMTYNVSRDCFNQNVRINCILPGPIETPFFAKGVMPKSQLSHLEVLGVAPTQICARHGTPEEVGSLVAFLLSDDASYINGESVVCAGGYGPISHVF